MFSGAESYKENALENKWVLSLFLNVLTLGAVLMSMGSSFQRKGAAAENERVSKLLCEEVAFWMNEGNGKMNMVGLSYEGN